MNLNSKRVLSALFEGLLRIALPPLGKLKRLYAHACLAAKLSERLPPSVVLLGKAQVYGTGNVQIGEDVLLYPDVHLETHGDARISIGDGVVLSRGVHLVAMAGISIGPGSMIGEFSGIRDGNHRRQEGLSIRDSGHSAKPIILGTEVWIGRGVTVLGGIEIGDKATVGANAVVTRDIGAGWTVAGVPAEPLYSRRSVALR